MNVPSTQQQKTDSVYPVLRGYGIAIKSGETFQMNLR